jgi:hypothetical protein
MKHHALVSLACILALGIWAGCSQRIGDFTLLSTKNVDIGGKYLKLSRESGSDSRPDILTVPIGIPDMKQAVDNCIDAGKGELLTNVVVDFIQWTAIVYGKRTYMVTGDVWGKATVGDLMSHPGAEVFELRPGASGLELVSTTNPGNAVKIDYLASGR